MRRIPTPPNPGDKISATLIRDIILALRERTPVQGTNTKLSCGPDGFAINVGKQKRASSVRLWDFACSEDPDTHERTGGWSNCRLQIGTRCWVVSEDLDEEGFRITGTDLTDDGTYYVEVDLREEKAEIKISETRYEVPHNDIMNDKMNFFIGDVHNGELQRCIDCIPVAYKYI